MARVNDHYLKLKSSYLFSEIARRVSAFAAAHPDARIIRLGIGDVTQPLVPAVVRALHEAVDEMASAASFRGYGPEPGYDFLTDLIAKHDYGARGVTVAPDEVFVSDGAKSDTGNVQEIFAADCVVALTDPVYPVYLDSNVMAGRTGEIDEAGRYAGVVYLPCTEANGFEPPLPDRPVDLVYLCFPNNPTGAVLGRDALGRWVDWARRAGAVLLYDAAYEAYIRDPEIPHSIYEIEGAREVAIEFRSFSKHAGFTGVRCAYAVVPKALAGTTASGERAGIRGLDVPAGLDPFAQPGVVHQQDPPSRRVEDETAGGEVTGVVVVPGEGVGGRRRQVEHAHPEAPLVGILGPIGGEKGDQLGSAGHRRHSRRTRPLALTPLPGVDEADTPALVLLEAEFFPAPALAHFLGGVAAVDVELVPGGERVGIVGSGDDPGEASHLGGIGVYLGGEVELAVPIPQGGVVVTFAASEHPPHDRRRRGGEERPHRDRNGVAVDRNDVGELGVAPDNVGHQAHVAHQVRPLRIRDRGHQRHAALVNLDGHGGRVVTGPSRDGGENEQQHQDRRYAEKAFSPH